MRLYLLGDLPESEGTSLEHEYFTDDEEFEQMWEVEDKLVEGYVRGRLSSEVLKGFERHYLASPVHRRRVAVVRNLIENADRSKAKETATTPRVTLQAWLLEKLGVSPETRRFALAAAMLLLVVGSLWLFIDRGRWRNEMAQLESESAMRRSREQALADQVAAARGESEKLQAELQRLSAERDAAEQQLARAANAGQSSRPAIFSSILSPVLVRGGGNPQILTIPFRTDVVRLQMKVDPDDRRHYQVNVRTEGRQVWKQQTVKPHIQGATAIITVRIPADKLALGDYILTLSAVNPTGKPEEVNGYFFSVIRQ